MRRIAVIRACRRADTRLRDRWGSARRRPASWRWLSASPRGSCRHLPTPSIVAGRSQQQRVVRRQDPAHELPARGFGCGRLGVAGPARPADRLREMEIGDAERRVERDGVTEVDRGGIPLRPPEELCALQKGLDRRQRARAERREPRRADRVIAPDRREHLDAQRIGDAIHARRRSRGTATSIGCAVALRVDDPRLGVDEVASGRLELSVDDELRADALAEARRDRAVAVAFPSLDRRARRNRADGSGAVEVARQHVDHAFLPQGELRIEHLERRDGDRQRADIRRRAPKRAIAGTAAAPSTHETRDERPRRHSAARRDADRRGDLVRLVVSSCVDELARPTAGARAGSFSRHRSRAR